MKQGSKNAMLITAAVMVALAAPLVMMGPVYTAARHLSSSSGMILPPGLRVAATALIAVVTYGLAYIFISFSTKRRRPVFNLVCFVLTALWCFAMAALWYLGL